MLEQPLLGHVHAKADIFETAYFFIRIRAEGLV